MIQGKLNKVKSLLRHSEFSCKLIGETKITVLLTNQLF